MKVNTKIINLIKMVYRDPEFMVETNGVKSEWKKTNSRYKARMPNVTIPIPYSNDNNI